MPAEPPLRPRGRKRGHGEGSIYQRADGRWVAVVEWPSPDGKRRRQYLYGRERGEVQRKLVDVLHAKNRGAPVPGNRTTLANYIETWLTQTAHRVQPRTLHRYRELLVLHVIPVIGRITLDKLRREHVEQVHKVAFESGLSDTTVHHLHTVLKQALTEAVDSEMMFQNPAQRIKPPRVKPSPMAPLTRAQARELVRAAATEPMGCLYLVAITTAMRQGELLALKWRDVDLERGVLSVVGSLERVKGTGLQIKVPKTPYSRRQIKLTRHAVEALRNHKAAQDAARELAAEWWDDHDLVFPNSFGRPMEAQNMMRRQFYPFLQKVGLPRIRFQDLRNTVATLVSLEGVNPKEVADLLGHASAAITLERYTRISAASHGGAARAMEEILDAED